MSNMYMSGMMISRVDVCILSKRIQVQVHIQALCICTLNRFMDFLYFRPLDSPIYNVHLAMSQLGKLLSLHLHVILPKLYVCPALIMSPVSKTLQVWPVQINK